jgi:hypothetical protein
MVGYDRAGFVISIKEDYNPLLRLMLPVVILA